MELVFGIVGLLLGGLIGFAGTFIFYKVKKNKKSVGVLRVDHSDPMDGPYLFLELKRSDAIFEIVKSKTVMFDVRVENYITQK